MKSPVSYNIIFAGTPHFSVRALSALMHSQHKVKAVYTQPDRPAGRGQKLTMSPVKEFALEHALPVFQPVTLRDENEQRALHSHQADLMIVVAYGLLLPLSVLSAPRLGCLNIHASLLPRWRGAAPIQRAILAGDAKTGVTIMQMNEGLDTGDMLFKKECMIERDDTSLTLHDKLAEIGADALLQTLDQLATLPHESQDDKAGTYAHKITKEEARIDWQQSVIELDRKIRAFTPWPIAFTQWGETVMRLFKAEIVEQHSASEKPGTLVRLSSEGMDVATGAGILRIKTVQFPGGRQLAISDVLNARQHDFTLGKVLG